MLRAFNRHGTICVCCDAYVKDEQRDVNECLLHFVDFRTLKFLTVRTVMGVELHHCAKFRQNRGRDIEIFRLFKMAAVAMLDFKNFKFLTVERVKKFEMHQYAKFRQNFVICGRGMVIFRFCKSSTLR